MALSRVARSPLTLRALRLVAAVHAHGSLGGAAEALHLSASTLSRAAQALEGKLGTSLFERGPRGMVLTPPAMALVRCHDRLQPLLRTRVLHLRSVPVGAAEAQRHAERLIRRLSEAMLASLAATADAGSETQAALRLGVTQPAVHQQLRALEALCEEPLLRRAAGGWRLTEAGERWLHTAKLVLNELRLTEDELAYLLGRGERGVVVGVLPMASTGLLPQAMARVWATDPALRMTVVDGTYDALLERLRCGDVDLLIGPLRGVRAVPEVVEAVLFAEPLVVVAGRAHALVGRREPLTLQQLLSWAWIASLPHTPARVGFDQLFADAGLSPPRPVVEANSPSLLRALLALGQHLALVSPLQIAQELDQGELVMLPVDTRSAVRQIGLTVRRQGRLPRGGERLVQALEALSGTARLAN